MKVGFEDDLRKDLVQGQEVALPASDETSPILFTEWSPQMAWVCILEWKPGMEMSELKLRSVAAI